MTSTASGDIQAAVSGDNVALEKLLLELIPVIRACVTQSLLRLRHRARGRNLGQEVEDLVQEALTYFIEKDCRVLATWDPAKGMSLNSFVSLVTGRLVTKLISRKKSSPWTEDPSSLEIDNPQHGGSGSQTSPIILKSEQVSDPEDITSEKELFARLVEHLSNALTPLGFQLFHMICIQSLSVEEICQRTDLSPDAVYAWRSRLLKTSRKIIEDLLSENSLKRQIIRKGPR